jgi:hypothetical protein
MRPIKPVKTRIAAGLTVATLLAVSGGAAAATAATGALASTAAGSLTPVARYALVDLTNFTPKGYNTPVPVAINSSGMVVGEVFSGGTPTASGSTGLAAPALPSNLQKAVAGTTAVPHVFIFVNDQFTVLPTGPATKQAWVRGLNDADAFTVATCTRQDCDHYFVVNSVLQGAKRSYSWAPLQSANLGIDGLGPIAENGDVTGAIGNPYYAVAVVWHLKRGGYSLPVALGSDPHAGHFARAYIPLTISSASGQDLVGGIEATPAFYPDGSPALWGPKFAHDFGWIGSETIAMAAEGKTTLATVGCPLPIPACAPSCPINALVDTISVVNGVPAVKASLKLANPPKSTPHCGVSPLALTVDPAGRPFTVGLEGLLGAHQYLPEAVIWVGAHIETLNNLIPTPHTNLQWAVGVNSAGQIIGTGTIGGLKDSAYLLTPTATW